MTIAVISLAAALAVAPADRMAMADRLYNRGNYAAALAEYEALVNVTNGIDRAELGYRLVSAANACGCSARTRKEGMAFLAAFPTDARADRVRLLTALAGDEAQRLAELKVLDRDGVAADIRAEALYRLAEASDDTALYERAFKTDPKGAYAPYAKFAHGYRLIREQDPARRRLGDEELIELAFGKDESLAWQALYLVALHGYEERRYGESISLAQRFLKRFPNHARTREVTRLLAQSLYMDSQNAAVVALCTDETDETLLALKALAQRRLGNADIASRLAERYLADFPTGANRKEIELMVARSVLDREIAGDDPKKILAAAERCAALAKTPTERLRLAWACEKAGEAERAEAEYAAIARDFPGDASASEALYRRALSLLRREKWSAAELSLAEAIASGRLEPSRESSAYYWRGIAASRIGHTAEAVEFLNRALAGTLTLDERREARLILADADFNAGRREAAVKAYAELVRGGAVERMSAAKTLAVGRVLDGEEACICARQLVGNASSEWRQAGYALLGDTERAAGNHTAAADAYRKALDEPCTTDVLAAVSLAYGEYLVREGRDEEAEKVLKRAVELNARDAVARAAAYLGLARAAGLRGDAEAAKGYATVVVTLFENTPSAAEAKELLK